MSKETALYHSIYSKYTDIHTHTHTHTKCVRVCVSTKCMCMFLCVCISVCVPYLNYIKSLFLLLSTRYIVSYPIHTHIYLYFNFFSIVISDIKKCVFLVAKLVYNLLWSCVLLFVVQLILNVIFSASIKDVFFWHLWRFLWTLHIQSIGT